MFKLMCKKIITIYAHKIPLSGPVVALGEVLKASKANQRKHVRTMYDQEIPLSQSPRPSLCIGSSIYRYEFFACAKCYRHLHM